jgi:hypothetical protein
MSSPDSVMLKDHFGLVQAGRSPGIDGALELPGKFGEEFVDHL